MQACTHVHAYPAAWVASLEPRAHIKSGIQRTISRRRPTSTSPSRASSGLDGIFGGNADRPVLVSSRGGGLGRKLRSAWEVRVEGSVGGGVALLLCSAVLLCCA